MRAPTSSKVAVLRITPMTWRAEVVKAGWVLISLPILHGPPEKLMGRKGVTSGTGEPKISH
jgi:hypothetical protein